jgi:hypothetical protein
VEALALGQEVNVAARLGDALYASRAGVGEVEAWGKVADEIEAVSLTAVDGRLVACLITRDNRVSLTTRSPAGPWSQPADVAQLVPGPGLRRIGCAGQGADLAVVVADTSGRVWESTRRSGAWAPLQFVPGTNGIVVTDVDVSNLYGDLHLLLSSESTQWHLARSEGRWSAVADLEVLRAAGMAPGVLGGAQVAALLELNWIQINGWGELWHSVRFRFYNPTTFALVRPFAPGNVPFAKAALAITTP